jgi:hypothetical protein
VPGTVATAWKMEPGPHALRSTDREPLADVQRGALTRSMLPLATVQDPNEFGVVTVM